MEANFDKNIGKTEKIGFKGKNKPSKPNLANNNQQINELPNDKGASRAYFMGGLSFKGKTELNTEDSKEAILKDVKTKLKSAGMNESRIEGLKEKCSAFLKEYEIDNCKENIEPLVKLIQTGFSIHSIKVCLEFGFTTDELIDKFYNSCEKKQKN